MKASKSPGLSKHLSLVRPGEPVLLVEYCSDCHTHNNSLRHDPEKYLQKAMEVKAAVQKEFPFFKIVLEPLDVTKKIARDRLGLFEVTMFSADSPLPQVLASKLKTLKWPEIRTIVSNVRATFPGRTLRVTFQAPPGQPFHPQNVIENSLKAVLASEFDLPRLQEQITRKCQRTSTAVPKNRKLSAIVQKKIQSGVVKEAEINDLLVPKSFLFEQRSGGDLQMEFVNVKPGAYKLVVLANKNFEQSSTDIFVLPLFRGREEPLHSTVSLVPQKTAFLSLAVEFEQANPVFRISFQRKSTGNGQSEAEEELDFRGESSVGGKKSTLFQIGHLNPGAYVLDCEFKNFQALQTEVAVYPGLNSLRLGYPDLRLSFVVEEVNQTSDAEKVTVSKELSALKDQGQKTHPRENSQRKRDRPGHPLDKENVPNHSRGDPNPLDRPNSCAAGEGDRADNEDRQAFQKQRGASGNRIRPGERLYSAKSKNNQQLVEEPGKNQLIVTGSPDQFRNDPIFQMLEKHLAGDCLNIFLRTNPQFKLEFEFVIDKGESIEDQSQFYQERLVEGKFEQHCLRHLQCFEFGRIFVERLVSKATERTELYLVNGGRVCRIDLGEYFCQLVAENECFCDVAIIVNTPDRTAFEELVGLVPMAEPIKCFTGILEIKSITNFVRNSKFGLEKFFGFDEDAEDSPRATLAREEVVESLRNYEIEFSSAYVLNAVRVDKKGTVCLQKVRTTFARWQQMGDAIDQLDLAEDTDEMDERDEEFETGGNLDEPPGPPLDEDDEFKEDEFDD